MRSPLLHLCLALCLAVASTSFNTPAQELLPNPGFERGTNAPADWTSSGSAGWSLVSSPQRHVISVRGGGEDAAEWQTRPSMDGAVAPGRLATLRFKGLRHPEATGGTGVAGTDLVHRDFPLTSSWEDYSFTFRQPEPGALSRVRLGQWHVRGELSFDDASLVPTVPLHARPAPGLVLGEAESIRGGVYRFLPRFGWPGANAHRPLLQHQGGFNTDRFLFRQGNHVIYRFSLPGLTQTQAQILVGLNHHESGAVVLEASRDASTWLELGRLDGDHRQASAKIPAAWLPAADLFIRLAMPGPGSAQVNQLEYAAHVSPAPVDAEGETHLLAIERQAAGVEVTPESLRFDPTRNDWEFSLLLSNRTETRLSFRGSLSSTLRTPLKVESNDLAPHRASRVVLRCPAVQSGPARLFVLIRDFRRDILFSASVPVQLATTRDPRAGYRLTRTNGLTLGWAESGWKIGADQELQRQPGASGLAGVALAAARGEYEAAQLVLRAQLPGSLRGLQLQDWKQPDSGQSKIAVAFNQVGYVQVAQPTDTSCVAGLYPDPLPPLRLPVDLEPGRNLPIWITVHVPPDAPAGEHRGTLLVQTTLLTNAVPFTVRVFDFEMPRETHLRTALGLGLGSIAQHHRLQAKDDQAAVFEKYLRNFAEHRISPYSFYDLAPIRVSFPETNGTRAAVLDFTDFDRAAGQWLDEAGFTTFQLPLLGMGGGTFHSRHLGELAGHKEGTSEHAALFQDYLGKLEAHLRERAWLSKAFTYWFDEPDPKDYPFVIEGMKRLKAAGPGIKRMLTEQPEPALEGHVDIWCALTPEWTADKAKARHDAGEEVWWYICTAPKAPYVTEFIDHPGTELRLWPWQSWQYGIDGLLIWATTYWHSPAAYPDSLQDPWKDPMSWVSGYGYQAGQQSPWGNGDGRFLYPPRPEDVARTGPILDGPVNSIRWEALRDGLEDYEYLWLLRNRIDAAAKAGREAALLDQARSLLLVPPTVSQDLTHFTSDPRPILEHRAKVAAMITELAPRP